MIPLTAVAIATGVSIRLLHLCALSPSSSPLPVQTALACNRQRSSDVALVPSPRLPLLRSLSATNSPQVPLMLRQTSSIRQSCEHLVGKHSHITSNPSVRFAACIILPFYHPQLVDFNCHPTHSTVVSVIPSRSVGFQASAGFSTGFTNNNTPPFAFPYLINALGTEDLGHFQI